jgi:hypothetical protein
MSWLPDPRPPAPLLRWGFVFLACPVQLAPQQVDDLVRLAIQAYYDESREVGFDWDELRGTVKATGEPAMLGSFVGQRFEAEVHRSTGSHLLQLLVTEHQLAVGRGPIAEA